MRFLATAILTGFLAACATTPSALQTFDDVYRAALTADDFVVTATTAALEAGYISSTQAAQVQKITVDAKNLLTASQIAFTAGNQIAANSDVAAASATLIAMSLCLTQKPLTITTFSACAATVPVLKAPL